MVLYFQIADCLPKAFKTILLLFIKEASDNEKNDKATPFYKALQMHLENFITRNQFHRRWGHSCPGSVHSAIVNTHRAVHDDVFAG